MDGRLITNGAVAPADNMAIDEALLRECDEGGTGFPLVRFYWWTAPTLSLGAKERLFEAADIEACRELGVALVRRPTGGRAVLHDHELTYAIVAPLNNPPFADSVEKSYQAIAEAMRKGLRRIGLDLELAAGSRKIRPRTTSNESLIQSGGGKTAAVRHLPCFAAPSRYELAWHGRKVIGSAQRRLKHAVLQHGSILLRSDAELLAKASGADPADIEELAATMIGIEEILGRPVAKETIIEALLEPLSEALKARLKPAELSEAERRRADSLVPVVESRLQGS